MPQTLRRLAATLAVAWGLVLAVAAAVGIPDALAAQRLIDGAHPLVQPAYLAREQAFIAEGRQAAGDLAGTALPRLAGRVGTTPAELQASIARTYPDVAAGLTRIPTILATTGKALGNLQRHHDDFVAAEAYPAGGLPRIGGAIAGMVFGLLLVVLGVVAWRRPVRWPLAALAVLGIAGAVVPLASSAPHKAEGVRAMVASLNLSTATATATRQSFEVVSRFDDQLEHRLLPDAASQAGTTPAALGDEITAGLPALQAVRRDFPVVLRTFLPDVQLREAAVDDFARLRDVPVVALTWIFIAACAAVGLSAAAAFAAAAAGRRLP